MRTIFLSEIADVQCGLVLNRKEAKTAEAAQKSYKRLNLRSLQETGHLNTGELDDFDSAELLDGQFLTQANDIIIRLFAPLSPVLIEETEIDLVVPSQLAVIRLMDNAPVSPGYLRWYLSSAEVSNRLLLAESSSVQRSIKIGALSTVPIPILPREKQELIIRIYETSVKRENLYRELMNQESIYMNGLLQKAIGGTVK